MAAKTHDAGASGTKITDIAVKIVALLAPLPSEERQRVIRASFTLLGENISDPQGDRAASNKGGGEDSPSGFPPKVQLWLKQNAVSMEELEQVFQIAPGQVDVIASDMPGSNKRAKTHSAYLLTGLAKFLETGQTKFDDKAARELCQTAGCFDGPNHATILKGTGNVLTGSKGGGWTITAPGLKRGAEMVKELAAKQ